MNKLFFAALFLLIFVNPNRAQEIKNLGEPIIVDNIPEKTTEYTINDSVSYLYSWPNLKILFCPLKDLYQGPAMLLKKKSIWPVVGVTAGTLALIAYDEQITDKVQQFCRYINLSQDRSTLDLSPTKLSNSIYQHLLALDCIILVMVLQR